MHSGDTSSLLDAVLTKRWAARVTEVSWLTPAEFSVWATTLLDLGQRDVNEVTGRYTARLLVALASMQVVCGVPLSTITARLAPDRRLLLAHALCVSPSSETWGSVVSSSPRPMERLES